MAEIVAGIGLSHSPLIMTNAESAGEKGKRFLQKAQAMQEWLKQQHADVIVLVSDDHFNSYYYRLMPSFTIGIGKCEGWGDWKLPKYDIPVEQDLAVHILNTGLQSGVDFTFTMSMKVDHGHTQAIYFLNPELTIPVVPIAVNTSAPPLPTMERCYRLGEVLRQSIESWPSDKKVAIIGSGGLSHWVPTPKLDSQKEEDQFMIQIMLHGRELAENSEKYNELKVKRVTQLQSGPVNEEWDRQFLNSILDGEVSALRAMTYEEIEQNGGNGGQEVRNWLVMLGAVKGLKPELVYYEPVPEWITGMAIMKFN
jgi:2,3-dihydroxyphenylpropionate 1,2-dioxygenase